MTKPSCKVIWISCWWIFWWYFFFAMGHLTGLFSKALWNLPPQVKITFFTLLYIFIILLRHVKSYKYTYFYIYIILSNRAKLYIYIYIYTVTQSVSLKPFTRTTLVQKYLWPFLSPSWRKCPSSTSHGCPSIYPIIFTISEAWELGQVLKNMKMWRLPIPSKLALWIEGIFHSSIKLFIFLLKDSAWNSL
jgi:hypothetical protein